jgi:NTE family protein
LHSVFFLEYFCEAMKKKVQLVLGMGGARGIAHIGVIEMLEAQGYEIVEVYGCSMGAIIGGLYCAGFLPQYKEWLIKQTKADIYRLFDLTFSLEGFVKGERIFAVLEQITGKHQIENLPKKFVAVATDMLRRREVYFDSGDLYKALRASSGIPGVFKPVVYEQTLYVDGGVLNPLPVDLVKRRDDAIVVAVNLNGPSVQEPTPVEEPAGEASEVEQAIEEAGDLLSRLRKYFFADDADTVKPAPKPAAKTEPAVPSFSMFELLSTSYDASLDRLVELMLRMHPVDMYVEIPRSAASVFEFYRAAELIEAGKKAYVTAQNNSNVGMP